MQHAFALWYGPQLRFATLKFIDFSFCLDSLFCFINMLICRFEVCILNE